MTKASSTENICCPEFNPQHWDDKTIKWENKRFVKAHVHTIFHMPINFGSIMKKLDKQVRKAGAEVPDWLCLSDHTSRWNMDLYLAVTKEVPGLENTLMNGTYYSKVYEGPYKDTRKWCLDYERLLKNKSQKPHKWYMWYTTCPKCAKKYGKNYVVIISKILEQ